jgi:hypothetical protein
MDSSIPQSIKNENIKNENETEFQVHIKQPKGGFLGISNKWLGEREHWFIVINIDEHFLQIGPPGSMKITDMDKLKQFTYSGVE